MQQKFLRISVTIMAISASLSGYCISENAQKKTYSPLTFHQAKINNSYCILATYNFETLAAISKEPFANPIPFENAQLFDQPVSIAQSMKPTPEITSLRSFGGGAYLSSEQICFASEASRQEYIEKLRTWVNESTLNDFADFESLAKRQTPTFELLEKLKNATTRHEAKADDFASLFPESVENVLSCSDGASSSLKFNLRHSTAYQLAENLFQINKSLEITAADMNADCCPPLIVKYHNQTITITQLNNSQPFLPQLNPKKPFQLVIGQQVLCSCRGETTRCCGGLKLEPGQNSVKNFLDNIESVLDLTDPDARALLEGENAIESPVWQRDIDLFNENSAHFHAEIIRNAFGAFAGVIMYRKIAHD